MKKTIFNALASTAGNHREFLTITKPRILTYTRAICLFLPQFILLCCSLPRLSAQEDYSKVITLNSDNDAFVIWENRDRFYTYGIGASMAFRSEKLLGLQNWFSGKQNHFFKAGIRVEGYTPTNKVITLPQIAMDTIIEFDRPFAGLLFGTLEGSYVFERSVFKAELLAGIMGPSSGAGDIQRWIHDNVTDDDVFDAWRFQVPDQLILNASATYSYDFTPMWKWADIYGQANARLGNLYIDATPSLGFRFGRFNPLGKSVSHNSEVLANSAEWELFIRSTFSARLAGFNGTAQGNLFNNDFEYAVDELNHLQASMSHGIFFAYRRVVLGFDHYFTYGDVVKGQRHIYARLEFRYRF